MPTPDFYDDADAFLAHAQSLLGAGATNRKTSAHTPTLATIGPDGAPRLRTLVLREHDGDARTLRVHTDRRAAKLREIAADDRVGVHVYDAGEKFQVRLDARAEIHAGDETARTVWDAMRGFSKRCYAASPAPGTATGAPVSGLEGVGHDADEGQDADRFENFAVLVLRYHALEALYLHADGHRRARFEWEGSSAPRSRWLVP